MVKKLLLGAILCGLFGLALEANLAGPERPADSGQQRLDPAGRRLFVLIIDSMDVRDADAMPAFQALAAKGLSATVEPCLERITYVCVKEALTGRSAFSLFGVLRNFGTASADAGDNLLRDAKAAGKTTALMSAGDLVPFHVDAQDREEHHDGYTPAETETALAWAATHDVTVYHYIWHDQVAHHDNVGTPAYEASVAAANSLIEEVVAGLPPDTDLIITGDHGHSDDGRHVQGQDIPTRLVALSPNLVPGALPDRFPIHGVRFLAAASAGLWTHQMDWDPTWSRLLSPAVDPAIRAMVEAGAPANSRRFPLGVALVALAMVAVAGWAAGPWAALIVALLGIGLGLGFEPWLDQMHFRGKGEKRVTEIWWWFPIGFTLLGAAIKRNFTGLWAGAALSVLFGLAILYPVPHHYGVLRNAPWLGTTLLLSSLLLLGRRGRLTLSTLVLLTLGAEIAFYGWFDLIDFKVFNLEITEWRGASWLIGSRTDGALFTAALATFVHASIDRHGGWRQWIPAALVSAVGASGLVRLPDAAYVLPMLALTAGFFVRKPWRGRLIAISFAWFVPFCYGPLRGYGLFGVLSLIAMGLWILSALRPRLAPAEQRLWTLVSALTVMVGAYGAFAYTFGLSIAGIDYTFMVKWMPGNWHERLWWLIFIGTTLKAMSPALISAELVRGTLGAGAGPVIDDIGRFAWLRAAIVYVFAFAWLLVSAEAAGLRLAAIVQDGFYWTLLGLFAAGAYRLGLPKPAAG